VDKPKRNCVYVGMIKAFGRQGVSTKKKIEKKKMRMESWSYKRNKKKRMTNIEKTLT
jgi:hypothetical protein